MRYNDKVKMFWRLGWHLFCGKFLRLMGGPRVQDDADSDTMLKDANVNFIVPSLRTKKSDSDFINPGVIIDFLNKYIKSAGPEAIKLLKRMKYVLMGRR